MDNKALIAIGVIAVLGVGTYVIVVNNNKLKESKTTPPKPKDETPKGTSGNDKSQTWYCKYLNIGCDLKILT